MKDGENALTKELTEIGQNDGIGPHMTAIEGTVDETIGTKWIDETAEMAVETVASLNLENTEIGAIIATIGIEVIVRNFYTF